MTTSKVRVYFSSVMGNGSSLQMNVAVHVPAGAGDQCFYGFTLEAGAYPLNEVSFVRISDGGVFCRRDAVEKKTDIRFNVPFFILDGDLVNFRLNWTPKSRTDWISIDPLLVSNEGHLPDGELRATPVVTAVIPSAR